MERVKKIFRRIHLFVWGLFILLVCLQLRSDGDADWLRKTAGFICTCMYVFYSHFYLLTLYPGKKKNTGYFPRLIAVLLTGPLPILFIYVQKIHLGYYCIHLATTVIIFLFLSWLAKVTENLVLNTIRKEQLEKQAVQAEMYYLKSQMAPHFLFNTLNNIHTLVYKQAPTAPEAVMHLASLMRYMIYESNAPTVPLKRELEYLQDYTSLQQLRYKQGPVVDIEIEGETERCHIAPLLFIHLLENAYKHSPAKLQPGNVKVKVEAKEGVLTFSVQNPIGKHESHALDEPGGIGLPNVKKRLALLYPGQHLLEIKDTGETFSVVLTITGLQLQPHERKADLLHH